MQVLPLPSTLVQPNLRQLLSSYLIDGKVSVDAGGLAFGLPLDELAAVKHILLTHTHLDHIASLPILLDQVYDGSGDCVTIHGTATTLKVLQEDIFNNRVWPDFIAISRKVPPYLKLQEFQPRRTFTLEGLRITPVPVDHVVECMGFVVEDDGAAVVFSGDTGPTEEIWKTAAARPNLKAAFLEVTFPEEMAWLAELAKHLTPRQFAAEVAKLPAHVRVLAVHLHARHRRLVAQELEALHLKNFEVTEFGKVYAF